MARKKNYDDETYSYQGWLNSDDFAKRAVAVAGYGMIGTLFIYLLAVGIILGFYVLLLILQLIMVFI